MQSAVYARTHTLEGAHTHTHAHVQKRTRTKFRLQSMAQGQRNNIRQTQRSSQSMKEGL